MPTTPDPALLDQLRSALASQFEIEGELGGGMSRVFSATERALGRRVVIKVLPPELTAGVNRDRFRREIQFAARLQHPHIVPLLTAGQVGDILYYTMPMVEGETLRARLEQRGRLDAATVVGILQDVVDAIAYAHGQGLIHRDIKPENILLQRHHALVTDFGVAKAISEALPGGGTGVTTVGIAVGTPAYMAPEQLAADPAADHRVDLYAVGLLAYELLSGSSPFAGSSPQQTLARQLTERPTPPHINRTDVPPALSSLIMRCLEKEPEDRWESADQLLQALQGVRITASGIPAVARTRRIDAGRPRRRVWVAVGALATITTVAIAGYVISNEPGAAPVPDSTPALAAAPAPPPPPPALTRADSEAIALSVARRMNQQRVTPSAALSQASVDSIKAEVERSVYDSVRRIMASRPAFAITSGTPGTPGITGVLPVPGGQERRRFLRVAVQDVFDATRDRSQAQLAAALTDSLRRVAGRRPATDVISAEKVRGVSAPRGNSEAVARELGADVLLRGIVERRGDSLRFTVVLHDVNAGQFGKSLRASVPVAEATSVMSAVSGPLTGWLNARQPRTRNTENFNFGPGSAADSALQIARRLRDSLRRNPPKKPDSLPPTA